MGINIQNTCYKSNLLAQSSNNNINKFNSDANKNELSKLLFGSRPSQNITFGWSKDIKIGSVEEKILNILTDPKNKLAIVGAHSKPDGDAYGSNLGIAGILKSMGVKAYSLIDDYPAKRFFHMPSPIQGKNATDFIMQPKDAQRLIGNKPIDIAVITDTAVPERAQDFHKNDNLVKMAAKAKNIIVIDHHPDSEGDISNEQQWKNAFAKYGANPDNVLYWRELRTSACEMIGELDKEIVDESKKGTLEGYNPKYNAYRLAIAGGLYTDTGATGSTKKDIRIARLSEKKVQAEDGKFMSSTRYIFNWLLDKCGLKDNAINFHKITSLPVPNSTKKQIESVVNGDKKVPGIEVKKATKNDPLSYIFITDRNYLNDTARELTQINKKKGSNIGKIYSSDVYKEFKEYAQHLERNKDIGILVVVSEFKDKDTGKIHFSASIRSYGYNTLKGETYEPGHVFADGAATVITNALKKAGLGTGGGHNNSTGFISNDNVTFKDDALPVIEKVVKEFIKDKDLRSIPKEYTADVVRLFGDENKALKLIG